MLFEKNNVLYINAKLQGFLVLGVQLNLNVFFHISKELIANKNSGYVLNQEQTEMNITKLLS